jgi:cytochrome b
MSTASASPAEHRADEGTRQRILVWDAPVRVFHWLMVLTFAGAWLTAESERWRLLHVSLGYTMAGLVGFRILWGVFGTRHARFDAFVRGPRAVARYLGSLLRGRPERHAGHNPAGALAILALLTLALAVIASGWATYSDLGGHGLEELHEAAASAMLAVVGVHVAAVLASSWLHRENLVGAMVSGRKWGPPQDGIRTAWRSVAAVMLVAVLGFWWLQWRDAPAAAALGDRPAASAKAAHDGDDD